MNAAIHPPLQDPDHTEKGSHSSHKIVPLRAASQAPRYRGFPDILNWDVGNIEVRP